MTDFSWLCAEMNSRRTFERMLPSGRGDATCSVTRRGQVAFLAHRHIVGEMLFQGNCFVALFSFAAGNISLQVSFVVLFYETRVPSVCLHIGSY